MGCWLTIFCMKTMLRVIINILIVVVCIGAILFISRNVVARKSVELGVRTVTGFPMKIRTVSLAANLGSITVTDMYLKNPEGFTETHFMDVTSMRAEFKPMSVVKRATHITSLKMDVPKLTIVRNKDGVYNVMRLESIETLRRPRTGTEKPRPYHLDEFTVALGTVTIEDESSGKQPTRTIKVEKEFTFKNITDADAVPKLILLLVMKHAELAQIGVNLMDLKANIGSPAAEIDKIVAQAPKRIVPATR